MSTHDLRQKVQRLTDLRRRYEVHEKLSDADIEELRRGIPAKEYKEIVIDGIRKERRAATPAKKVRVAKEKIEKEKIVAAPIDLDSFLDEEHT